MLAELHQAWSVEQSCADQLALLEPWRDTLRQVVAQEAGHAGELTRLDAEWRQTALVAERAKQTAQASTRAVAAEADRIRDSLLTAWDGDRPAARVAARVVLDGPGRLHLRRAAVARASQQLTGWADRWRPHRPDLPTDPTQLAQEADGYDDRAALWQAFDTAARRTAEHRHPEQAQLHAVADTARHTAEEARRALAEARHRRDERLTPRGPLAFASDPVALLTNLEREVVDRFQQLTNARTHITALTAEPAVRALPPHRLAREHDTWGRRPRRRPRRRTEGREPQHRVARGRACHAIRGRALPLSPACPGPERSAMSRTFESRRRPTWRHLGTGPQSFGVGRRIFHRIDDLHDRIDVQHGYGRRSTLAKVLCRHLSAPSLGHPHPSSTSSGARNSRRIERWP